MNKLKVRSSAAFPCTFIVYVLQNSKQPRYILYFSYICQSTLSQHSIELCACVVCVFDKKYECVCSSISGYSAFPFSVMSSAVCRLRK